MGWENRQKRLVKYAKDDTMERIKPTCSKKGFLFLMRETNKIESSDDAGAMLKKMIDGNFPKQQIEEFKNLVLSIAEIEQS